MAPIIRTQRDVIRWIVIQTVLTLAVTVPTTLALSMWFIGGDLSAMHSGAELLRLAGSLVVVEVVLFTPPIALRSVGSLRSLHLMRERLHDLARRDPLTGLLNRRGFEEELSLVARDGALAVLMCDLDHFKHINDRYGHGVGDNVLVAAAALLVEHARSRRGAVIGRFGGEEFVVALPGAKLDEALLWADFLRGHVAAHRFDAPDEPIYATISIGLAACEVFDGSIGSLVSDADEALYRAKRQGRNRVVSAMRSQRVTAVA